MDKASAWMRGHQVVRSLRPSSWWVGSDWPNLCPSHPGFQLLSSLQCQSQLEALCRFSQPTDGWCPQGASQTTFVIWFHTNWAWNARHPTSSHQPCCPHLVPTVLDKLLVLGFLPRTRMIFFPSGGHMIISGVRVVDSTISGKWSLLPRSTSFSQPGA